VTSRAHYILQHRLHSTQVSQFFLGYRLLWLVLREVLELLDLRETLVKRSTEVQLVMWALLVLVEILVQQDLKVTTLIKLGPQVQLDLQDLKVTTLIKLGPQVQLVLLELLDLKETEGNRGLRCIKATLVKLVLLVLLALLVPLDLKGKKGSKETPVLTLIK